MIAGIGCDIISVERIQRIMENNPSFAAKVFLPAEISYCQAKANPYQSFAARFSAKEAVMKALGTGWNGKVNWLDIEVQISPQGSAHISLSKGAKARAAELKVTNIQLSLSHEKEQALAFVVMETEVTGIDGN